MFSEKQNSLTKEGSRRSGLPSYANTFTQQFVVSLTNMSTDMVRSMNSLAVEVLVSKQGPVAGLGEVT